MKTYSIFCTSLTTLFNDNNLVVGNSPKAALERSINKKVKRTTDNFAIDFIVEEVNPCGCGKYTRMAGKPRLCYTVL